MSDPELWIVSEKEDFEIPDKENAEKEIELYFLTIELKSENKYIEHLENSLSFHRGRQEKLAEKIKNLLFN